MDEHSRTPSRLTVEQRAEARRRLAQWMTPDAFASEVNETRKALGDYVFVQSGLAFLHDAHCAAEFARLREATEVRLIPPECDRPDFEVKFGTDVQGFEVTEALKPGRKRGEEFRVALGEKNASSSTFDEPDVTLVLLSEAIAALVAVKSKILYPLGTRLLIYVNRPARLHGLMDQDRATIAASIQVVDHTFREVWLLGGVGALRLHPLPFVELHDAVTNPPPHPAFRPTPLSEVLGELSRKASD